jgi:hypothetical protein
LCDWKTSELEISELFTQQYYYYHNLDAAEEMVACGTISIHDSVIHAKIKPTFQYHTSVMNAN